MKPRARSVIADVRNLQTNCIRKEAILVIEYGHESKVTGYHAIFTGEKVSGRKAKGTLRFICPARIQEESKQ